MGLGGSKEITYKEATSRCSPEELARLKKGYQVLCDKSKSKKGIDKGVFIREVLGATIPPQLAAHLVRYLSRRTTTASLASPQPPSPVSSLNFKGFLCGIVLLSKGTIEEKTRLAHSIYTVARMEEDATQVLMAIFGEDIASEEKKNNSEALLDQCKDTQPKELMEAIGRRLSFSEFKQWVTKNKDVNSLAAWIVEPPQTINFPHLKDDQQAVRPIAYSMADQTHFQMNEITCLEREYDELLKQSSSGKVVKDTLSNILFRGELPSNLINSLFESMDVDKDGVVNIREFVCSMSVCCKGTKEEMLEFYFNVFDSTKAGSLSRDDVMTLINCISVIESKYMKAEELKEAQKERIINQLFENPKVSSSGRVSLEAFKEWAGEEPLIESFMRVMKKISSRFLGLKPGTAMEEREAIQQTIKDTYSTIKEGDNVYLISSKWWNQWKVVGGDKGKEPEIGSIDNDDLLLSSTPILRLKPGLQEDKDYVIVTLRAWKTLSNWYGGGPAISREVLHLTKKENGEVSDVKLDLYPIRSLTILRKCRVLHVTTFGKKVVIEDDLTDITFHSLKRRTLVRDLRKRLCLHVHIANDNNDRVRLWNDVYEKTSDGAKPRLAESKMLDLDETLEEANIQDGQTIFFELQRADGTWPRDTRDVKKVIKTEPAAAKVAAPAITQRGVIGLTNLGNTCFMNAAIQCLSNTPLTQFFLTNRHVTELNPINPIGYRGEFAKKFALLIKEIWASANNSDQSDPKRRVIEPLMFRRTIARFVSQFDNDLQQDAQEFLAVLLDGLHEGLNRIKNKPYVPFEIEEGMTNEEIAKRAWTYYQLRNQSVIVDLFQGQTMSSLACQECEYVSVTFEPFTFLSLPLPLETMRVYEVLMIFAESWKKNVKYGVRMNKELRVLHLKEEISKLSGIPMERLEIGNAVDSSVAGLMKNDMSLLLIPENTVAFAFETVQDPSPNEGPKDDFFNVYVLNLPIVNRLISKVDVYFLNPYKATAFGDPAVASIVLDSCTNNQVYQLVWNALTPNMNSTTHFGTKGRYPFSVKVVNKYGTGCGLCTWDRFCLGCEVPQNDELVLNLLKRSKHNKRKLGISLGVDWEADTAKVLYNAEKRKDITVDVSVEKAYEKQEQPLDLMECINFFQMEEFLGEDALWTCPKCTKSTEAKKTMKLWMLPTILIIHLKRFQRTAHGNHWVKSGKLVLFPLTLDLSSFVPESQREESKSHYELVAVLNHFGGLSGGHYIATARNPENKKWYRFDDSRCTEVDEENICSSSAYVLFYQKVYDSNLTIDDLSPLPPNFEPIAKGSGSESHRHPCKLM